MSVFSDRLQQLREAKNWNKSVTAEKLGVSAQRYSNWEYGNREPDFNMLTKIAALFDTSTDYLIGKIDSPTIYQDEEPGSTSQNKNVVTFNTRLEQLRESRHWSKTKVANMLGLPLTTYANYEYGIREPNIQTLNKISKVFNVPVDYLIANDITDKNASTELKDRLKALRTNKGWSKTKVAKDLGVGLSTYANWEYGYSQPDSTTLGKIASLYDGAAAYLLGSDIEQPQSNYIPADLDELLSYAHFYDGKLIDSHDKNVIKIFLDALFER